MAGFQDLISSIWKQDRDRSLRSRFSARVPKPPLPTNNCAQTQRLQRVLGTVSVRPEPDWTLIKRTLRLSPRELAVVRGLFEGRKLQAIADDLGISLHTVDTYWRQVQRKLHFTPGGGGGGRTELIHRVHQIIIQMRVEESKQAAIAAIRAEAPQAPPPQAQPSPVPVSRMLPPAG